MIVPGTTDHFNRVWLIACLSLAVSVQAESTFAQEGPQGRLRKSVLLYASFDAGADADFAQGDRRLYSSESTRRESNVAGLRGAVEQIVEGGRVGGRLQFNEKSQWFPFFKGEGNFPMPSKGKPFQGTVSLWMKLDPAKDLPAGFVDPIQITDKKWNDASFFLDFTKDNPRQFRLGAYSNYKFWNPKALKYDEIPDAKRPLGALRKLPFSRDRWTHVTFTWSDFNTDKMATATLFIDGRQHAVIQRRQQYDWQPGKVAIMLGIFYVGQIDELAVFSRALSNEDVSWLHKKPELLRSLCTAK